MRRILIAGALWASACSSSPKLKPGPENQPPEEHPPVTVPASKRTGRVSLSQLRASFPVVLGNDASGRPITWNSGSSSSPQPGFDVYARTLGEADFIGRTEDDRDASPIYVKFMDDAARSGCDQVLTADERQNDPTRRTLLRFVSFTDTPDTNSEGFRQNLAYLKLRFHGVKVNDDRQIEALQTLFIEAGSGSSVPIKDGWRAVCVALLTAPEFHLY